MHNNSFYQQFISRNIREDNLIVQPRMGFSQKELMSDGLMAVKSLNIPVIGTITIDSFTRARDFKSAKRAIEINKSLNGYPIVSYSKEENNALISKIRSADFPIQIRHGSPQPEEIFKSTIAANIDAIEGGPISYCLPYSRIPINKSISSWIKCCELFATAGNGEYHIESFGGCMMGQLCPPSLLIAITLLEALFFKFYGIKSVSVSLTQGTNSEQDLAALAVLNQLSDKYLGQELNWHIVYYTFMGKFPETFHGAKLLIEESALIAKQGGANRLIVKTANEAHQIPTIKDNLEALKWANTIANQSPSKREEWKMNITMKDQIYQEADALIEAVLNLSNKPGDAIEIAFKKGYLDIPFCLHQCNNKRTLSQIDSRGNIIWTNIGNMPIAVKPDTVQVKNNNLTSNGLIEMLSYNQFKYDYKLVT